MGLETKKEKEYVSIYEDGCYGQKWLFPKCVKCKYCNEDFCEKYKGYRMDLPIDLFECPAFEEEKKEND